MLIDPLHAILLGLISAPVLTDPPGPPRLTAVELTAVEPTQATAERFFAAPISELDLDGPLPARAQRTWTLHSAWAGRRSIQTRVVMEGGSEAYLYLTQGDSRELSVAARIAGESEQRGWLELPEEDADGGVERIGFRIPAGATSSDDRLTFHKAARDHYRFLLDLGAPGSAWFRMRMLESDQHLAEPIGDDPNRLGRIRSRESDLEESMALFTGSRAIAENLQLDRAMLLRDGDENKTLSIDSLDGITIEEIDWSKLNEGVTITPDPLAALIPADQHALLFPTFEALVSVVDEADRIGTPLLEMIEARSADEHTRARYEKQLGLGLDAWSRELGPKVIRSVAVTGSDPYLQSGTDVAVLFDSHEPAVLLTMLSLRHAQAAAADDRVKTVEGEIGGLSFHGIQNPSRSIHSLVLKHENTVLVTNSEVQIRAFVDVIQKRRPRLVDLGEYTFFRNRYPLAGQGLDSQGQDGESAFLILSDAAIRRWCGPRSRIGASRRIRAQALMAHHRALSAAGEAGMEVSQKSAPIPEGFGDLTFLTPISELALDLITEAEATAYRRFRNTYQQNWDGFFDPIAVSIRVSETEVAADVTVMPLIGNTDFREMIDLSAGSTLTPTSGDPHDGSLLHWAMALNKDSELLRGMGDFFDEFGFKANALSWLGDHVSVFIDEDPYLAELAALPENEIENHIADNITRLPVAFLVDVDKGFGVAAFLTAARAFAQQTVPGMLAFETVEHGEMAYVKIRLLENLRGGRSNELADDEEDISVCYAVTPDRLIFTPNEPLLRRWLDRRSDVDLPEPSAWAGENVAVRIHPGALGLIEGITGTQVEIERRNTSFMNLHILNEWQRLFPNQDPAAVHAQIFEQELLCTGGGEYRFDADLRTVESSVYGSPAAPRLEPTRPTIFQLFTAADAGVTFEHNGLRAKVRIAR